MKSENGLNSISREEVLQLLDYDAHTGCFYWKQGRKGCTQGSLAGSVKSTGYRAIKIAGVYYQAHRLVWLVETGEMPKGVIDHIDRNRTNNRFQNLRDTSVIENNRNVSLSSRNQTGVVGVSFDDERNQWRASISVDGKSYSTRHNSLQEAQEGRSLLEKKYRS